MAAAPCAAPRGVFAAAGAAQRLRVDLGRRDGASVHARVAPRVRSRGSVTVRAAITDPPEISSPPKVQGPAVILPQVPIHSEAGDIMDVFPEDMILEPGELGAVSRGVMRAVAVSLAPSLCSGRCFLSPALLTGCSVAHGGPLWRP